MFLSRNYNKDLSALAERNRQRLLEKKAAEDHELRVRQIEALESIAQSLETLLTGGDGK